MERLAYAFLGLYIPLAIGIVYRKFSKNCYSTSRDLSRLVLYFFLPLLLFDSISRKRFEALVEDFFYMVSAATVIALISIIAALVVFRGEREMVLPSTYLNALYLPIPIAYTLWGPESLYLAGFYALVNTCLGNISAPLLLVRGGIKRGIKRLFRFPPFYAVLLGMLVSASKIQLPRALGGLIADLGRLAPYLALIVLGLQASDFRNIVDRDTRRIVIIRFVISPLSAFMLFPLWIPVHSLAFKVALIESFMPPAVSNVILANELMEKPERIANVVFKATLLSTLIIPLLIVVVGSI